MSDAGANERRLAAIVFTDVVGYSARMQRDETGTMALVRVDFERMRALCAQHGGEVLKSTGDGLLLCFSSVVQAVACGLQIQKEFGARPADTLQHRMGIHLGDVFRADGDVTGDGVNIAARMETKARPGTICLSQSVYDAVKGKLPMAVEPLGPQQFKNITEPIVVYLVSPVATAPAAAPAKKSRTGWLAGAVLVLGAALAVMFWPKPEPTAGPKPAGTAPTAPMIAVKSIAVLPFINMSDDKDSGYFADGVHEDLLTNLANLSALKVISRTSVMQYRGTTKTIHQIADELGVAYLLEGSVRRSGNKVRVTGQLIRAATDEHVWAKTYDRDLTDVFVIQTELSHEIALALQAVLTPRENARLEARPTRSVEAYEIYQQALTLMRRGVVKATLDQALPLLGRAVEIDPNYAKAWAAISNIQGRAYWRENNSSVRLASMREALARAEKADPNDYEVLDAGVGLGAVTRDRAKVAHYQQKIIELFPNRAEAYLVRAINATQERRWADALAAYAKARLLDPFNVDVLSSQADLLRSLRHYAETEAIDRILVRLNPEDNDAALNMANTPFLRTGSTRELKALLAGLPPEDRPQQDPFVHYTRLEVMIALGDADGMIRLWHTSGGDALFRDYTERQARMLVAAAYLSKQDFASARPLLEKNRDSALTELAGDPAAPRTLNDLGLALAMLGELDAGRAQLARAREILQQSPPDRGNVDRFYSTICLAWVGEKAEAVAGLTEILRSPYMAKLEVNVYRLRYSLLTLPLRGDPAFEAMLNDPANNAPHF